MAIAGIVLSAVWTVGIVFLIVVALAVSSTGDNTDVVPTTIPTTVEPTTVAPSTSAPPTAISATDLEVGECLNGLRAGSDVTTVPSVPCEEPHEGEVFAVFDLPSGDYPGNAAVESQVDKGCETRLAAYSPSAPTDSALEQFFIYPQERNWIKGDREVVCIAKAASGTTTGSIKGN
jgi:Septum formation